MNKIYNPKEAYILGETAKKLRKGEIPYDIIDAEKNIKIYSTILDKNYEITITKVYDK